MQRRQAVHFTITSIPAFAASPSVNTSRYLDARFPSGIAAEYTQEHKANNAIATVMPSLLALPPNCDASEVPPRFIVFDPAAA